MACYSRFLVFPLFIWGRQMFLSAFVCECKTTLISCSPHRPLNPCTYILFKNVFAWFPQTYIHWIWQSKCFCSQSRLRLGWFSQKRLSLKKKREQERRCFLFSLSSSEDRYLKEIYKDRGELTVLCWGWKWQAKKKGLNAWRQRRKCKTENNQKGDLLYLFESRHNSFN